MRPNRHSRAQARRALPALVCATLMLLGGASLAGAEDLGSRQNAAPQNEAPAQAGAPAPTLSCWDRTGRVQPTLCDLPPAVARSEGKPTPKQEAFDKKLDICRDC